MSESGGAELTLRIPREPSISLSPEAGEFEDSGHCTISGGPYSSREATLNAALRAKEALLIWAVREEIGIDFSIFGFSDDTSRKDSSGLQEILNVDELTMASGIEIMAASTFTLGVLINVIPNADRTPEAFAEEFRVHHSASLRLTPKQIIAIQLYNSTAFNVADESRFISMISAVEALIDSTVLEPPDIVMGLNELAKGIETLAVTKATKERLSQKLEKAKELSIAKGGKHLVSSLLPDQTYEGKSASKTFERLYSVRSKLVHDGHTGLSKKEFQGLEKLCRTFVSDLLLASIAH